MCQALKAGSTVDASISRLVIQRIAILASDLYYCLPSHLSVCRHRSRCGLDDDRLLIWIRNGHLHLSLFLLPVLTLGVSNEHEQER